MKFTRFLSLLLVLALPAVAQQRRGGRGLQTDQPDATASRPTTTPATTPAAETPRVTYSGNTPIADKVDETPIVTHHELQFGGVAHGYTATVGQMPILNPAGETEAHFFYIAYTLDEGTNDLSKRPVTFAFNGGPGSASIWLHMGALGPKRVKLTDTGDMPPPPYKLVDNEDTILDSSDLVFIDAIGTGYSTARSLELARKYNGVQGDLQSFGEFIRMYLTRNGRWVSPLFLAGESYGTFRAAGLAGSLIDQGIAFNGVMLISTVLNFDALQPRLGNGLAYALNLPTYTADAWYHHKLAPELQKDLKATLKECEAWSMTGYLEALNKGDQISETERKEVVAKLARFTGLDPRYVDQSNLRFGVGQFTRELLRNEKLIIGRYDGRLTGPAPLNMGETADFDPSGSLPLPPFRAVFMDYVRNELGYKTDATYYVSGGVTPWDWGSQNSYADTSSLLHNAFTKDPHLRVHICAGYYDLATPYWGVEYTLNHLGIHPETQKSITWQFFEAGHMMYIDRKCHAQLKQDLSDFIRQSMPQP